MVFRFFRVVIWMVCLFRLFFPSIDSYLGMLASFQRTEVILLGIIMLSFGTVSAIAIHHSLGQAWRSGIDPKGPKEIISNGVYKYSRNPMFVCVAVGQLGFFLALPSLFSLICLAVGLFSLNKQVLAEEEHLLTIFPDKYKDYTSRVRRWI